MTAYELLEYRFDVKTRLLASAVFQLIICVSTGVVIYAPAIMLAEMSGFSVMASIWIVGIVTTVYTMFGGIKSVIYTDILQTLVFMAGWFVAVLFILAALPGGITDAWTMAAEQGKLRVFDFSTELQNPGDDLGRIDRHDVRASGPQRRQSGPGAEVSVGFQREGRAACHLVSRLLPAGRVRGLLCARDAVVCVLPDAAGKSSRTTFTRIGCFPYFIVHEVPVGLRGFLIAGAFSAAMSTLSSALNSLANVTVVDFLDRFRPGNTVRRAKVLTVVWGGVVIGAGLLAVRFGSILELIVKVNSYFYGCLLGVFLLGMGSKRGDQPGGPLWVCSTSMVTILLCAYFRPGLLGLVRRRGLHRLHVGGVCLQLCPLRSTAWYVVRHVVWSFPTLHSAFCASHSSSTASRSQTTERRLPRTLLHPWPPPLRRQNGANPSGREGLPSAGFRGTLPFMRFAGSIYWRRSCACRSGTRSGRVSLPGVMACCQPATRIAIRLLSRLGAVAKWLRQRIAKAIRTTAAAQENAINPGKARVFATEA